MTRPALQWFPHGCHAVTETLWWMWCVYTGALVSMRSDVANCTQRSGSQRGISDAHAGSQTHIYAYCAPHAATTLNRWHW